MEIPEHVLQYMGGQKTLTVATVAPDGTPHAATLVYAGDGGTIYLWAHAGSQTAEHIGAGSVVGFAIDEYSEDPRQTKGVQGSGDASAVAGEELARAGDLFGRKFPSLRPGASGAVSFFKIEPLRLHFIDNTQGESAPEPDEYRRTTI